MIRNTIYIAFILLAAGCTMPEEKEPEADIGKKEPAVIETMDTNAAKSIPALPLPVSPPQRNPTGIYRAILPLDKKVEQTVLFNENNTYKLQEKYRIGNSDSIVIVEGTWAPSDGFIWLYKDQVVRARYRWKDGTLQYYHPVTKKGFSMERPEPIMNNEIWKKRSQTGIAFFGIGNEPFWNIEISSRDSLSFTLSDWEDPLRLSIHSARQSGDTIYYDAGNDSVSVRVNILPYFCSDGMSDYIYMKAVNVFYNDQLYKGCGAMYKD